MLHMFLVVLNIFWAFNLNAQNQLPLPNGNFETTNSDNSFSYWSNDQIEGGQAIYTIATENLISGSTKAQKSEIIALGTKGWHVKTKSDYLFQVEAGQTYTIRFWAKMSGSSSATLKVVFQASDASGSFQGNDKTISQDWQQYTHSFTVAANADFNKLSFWYMDAGVTYYIDEVEVVEGNPISFNQSITYQTVDGFGAGIKRRTEDLYTLNTSLRNQIETHAFQDLEANMIRFFVYHDLEDPNDNNDPFDLNAAALDWTRYEDDPNIWRSRYVAEALNNAFSLSVNGFDHIIGNCNSAPAWLKTNNSHTGENTIPSNNTLVSGGENEYSEFLVAFIKGMASRYNINVTAISPTNEPDFQVTYESMNTTPSQLASIIKNLDQRLTIENFDNIQIISPENFRVNSPDPNKSATNYIDAMFTDPGVVNATDIVATHTYQPDVIQSDWSALKSVSQDKDIWVTEAGNLNSPDFDMLDASYSIDRIMDGFNYGGLTAYMFHLFYEQAKFDSDLNDYTSSALVVWDLNNNIILPKRYYVFKHFTNLVKKGYQRIHSETFGDALRVLAFKSPNNSKIVVQLYTENNQGDFDVEIPFGTTSVEHYITSDNSNQNFTSVSTANIDLEENYMTMSMDAMSMHSLVFNIDTSLSSDSGTLTDLASELLVFPTPAKTLLELRFPFYESHEISIFQYNGSSVFTKKYPPSKNISLDVQFLPPGFYILKSTTQNSQRAVKLIIEN